MARVSDPIAPSIVLLSALLTRTFLKAAASTPSTGAPVLALRIAPGGGLVGDEMIGRIDQQAIVAERVQNGRGLRRRLGRQFADRRLGLRKFVVEELGQRVVDGVGASGGREHEQRGIPSARTARR